MFRKGETTMYDEEEGVVEGTRRGSKAKVAFVIIVLVAAVVICGATALGQLRSVTAGSAEQPTQINYMAAGIQLSPEMEEMLVAAFPEAEQVVVAHSTNATASFNFLESADGGTVPVLYLPTAATLGETYLGEVLNQPDGSGLRDAHEAILLTLLTAQNDVNRYPSLVLDKQDTIGQLYQAVTDNLDRLEGPDLATAMVQTLHVLEIHELIALQKYTVGELGEAVDALAEVNRLQVEDRQDERAAHVQSAEDSRNDMLALAGILEGSHLWGNLINKGPLYLSVLALFIIAGFFVWMARPIAKVI